MASTKTTPRDAAVMAAILKDMGVIEYEPRVINQMLEFTYRYITNILDDARVFSNHAKKKAVDVEDVKLAIQMQMDKSFTTPPPRDILIDIARQRNNTPLPLIKPHCGLRLPPDRYCLSACNYHMKASKKPRQHGLFTSITAPKLNLGAVTTKLTPAISLATKSGSSLSLINKGITPPTVTVVARPATTGATPATSTTPVSTTGSTIPTPVFKLSSGMPTSSLNSPLPSAPQGNSTTGTATAASMLGKVPSVITRTIPLSDSLTPISDTSGKRKREEDEDYDAE